MTTHFIFPKPQSEDTFEDMVCDIFARKFNNPNLQRYGRSGQAQDGIDVVGTKYIVGQNHQEGHLVAIQCKNHVANIADKKLQGEVEAELDKLEKTALPVRKYLFVTSADTSASVQNHVINLNANRLQVGKCGVEILFWDYVVASLYEYPDLLYKYFSRFLPTQKLENLLLPDLHQNTRQTLNLTIANLLDTTQQESLLEQLQDIAWKNLLDVPALAPYNLYLGLSTKRDVDFSQQVDLHVDFSTLFQNVDDLEGKYTQIVSALFNLAILLSDSFFARQVTIYSDIEINLALLLGRVFRRHKLDMRMVFKDWIWTSNYRDVPVVLPNILEDGPRIDSLDTQAAAFVFNATSRTNILDDVTRNLALWSKKPQFVVSYHLQQNGITSSAHALSVAKSIAAKLQNMETWGVRTIHLFLVMPKPLAALIGYHLDTLNVEIHLYFMGPDRQTYLKTGVLTNNTFTL